MKKETLEVTKAVINSFFKKNSHTIRFYMRVFFSTTQICSIARYI